MISFLRWLLGPLLQQNHTVTLAMHTWRLHGTVSYVWDQPHEVGRAEDAFDVFHPEHRAIDDQDAFVAGLAPERYYASEEKLRWVCPPWYPLNGEPCKLCDASRPCRESTLPSNRTTSAASRATSAATACANPSPCYESKLFANRTVLNEICAMESQKRAYRMLGRAPAPFDFVIFCRPDLRFAPAEERGFSQPLPDISDRLIPKGHLLLLNTTPIVGRRLRSGAHTVQNGQHGGYEDLFAVVRGEDAASYSGRLDKLHDYIRSPSAGGYFQSERFLKYIIDHVGLRPLYVRNHVHLVRPNVSTRS